MHLPMLMHEASCTQGARLLCTRAAVLVLSVMLCGDGPEEGARPCNPHAVYHNTTLPALKPIVVPQILESSKASAAARSPARRRVAPRFRLQLLDRLSSSALQILYSSNC